MDPDRVVLEISSDDEEVVPPGWDWSKGICDGEDHNWLTELLDEVDRENDDSDDVVVVSEVVISPPSKQRLKKDSLKGLDDDDECVILDGDPDEAMAVRSDGGGGDGDGDDDDDDDDELVVVKEKGQVACRDYPHPRHLCVQFPFSSTSHERYCDQCHCYVCDSLAPCVHWGAGHSSIDHCHAHDKEEYWRAHRKSTRSGDKVSVPVPKVANAPFSTRLPQLNQIPPLPAMQVPIGGHPHQVSRPTSLRACSRSTKFPMPNLISQSTSRSIYHTARNKFQPNLVSQQLLSTCNSSTNPRDRRHNSGSGNLGLHVSRAAFKRTGSAGGQPTNSRGSYSSSRVTHGSQFLRCSPPVATRNPTRLREFHDVIVSGSNSSVGPSQPVMANVFDSVPSRGTSFEKPLHYQSTILPRHPTADTLYENPVIFQSEATPQPNGGSTPVDSMPSQPQVSVQPNYPVPSQLQMPSLHSLTGPPQPQVSVQPNYLLHSSSPNYPVPSQPQTSSQSRVPVLSEIQVNTQFIPVSDYSQFIAEQQIQTETDVDPDLPDFDLSWMTASTENSQQPSTKNTQAECIAPTNEHALVADPGLVDEFQYGSWIFDNQPVEPGTMDATLSGTNGFSPEPGLIDTGKRSSTGVCEPGSH